MKQCHSQLNATNVFLVRRYRSICSFYFTSSVMSDPAMDGEDARSSTDLARAWEAIDGIRRRGHQLQLAPCMHRCTNHRYIKINSYGVLILVSFPIL